MSVIRVIILVGLPAVSRTSDACLSPTLCAHPSLGSGFRSRNWQSLLEKASGESEVISLVSCPANAMSQYWASLSRSSGFTHWSSNSLERWNTFFRVEPELHENLPGNRTLSSRMSQSQAPASAAFKVRKVLRAARYMILPASTITHQRPPARFIMKKPFAEIETYFRAPET